MLLTQKQKGGSTHQEKLAQLFEHIIEGPEKKDPNVILEESSFRDNLSAEENHIIIKEDGIE